MVSPSRSTVAAEAAESDSPSARAAIEALIVRVIAASVGPAARAASPAPAPSAAAAADAHQAEKDTEENRAAHPRSWQGRR